MNAINYSEYEPEHSGNFLTEASLKSTGFDIRLEHARWENAGSALIQTHHHSCLIRLMLPSDAGERTQPAGNLGRLCGPASQGFRPLGPLLFIPNGSEFHLKHRACQQKALICVFDPAALATLACYRWNWDGCVDASMLNLQSLYLRAALQRLAEEVAAPGFASELHTESLLTCIALDLRRQFLGIRPCEDGNGKLTPRQMSVLRELLDAGPETALSLQYLANACALPVRKLSSYFKNTTGKTLRRYAAESRVEKAMALLADPQLLVKQVAYQAGFQNPAAFTAAFRKAVGMTPEEFRRQRSG
ncbi:helix-turn-helix domain-containing protein [Pseudomonas typographi]|uniref:Helix-turn-helix transcriptional regulator n=1 Tax=Pseudomonas typographi TaxID=2715964 RepID=A0ABR7YWR3_9PSED|nr:AraC family transcriptional regulator [Pseudomonas typographi]MBD1552576.1 helix-turn-helix transcriptional regulator [Pseudomonas typographi]MBD1586156.1 helix-turn-helix transcriptional regulator [Pseudomonas typographi]MBD1597627.1 helix-turn-helix transcriptional regulator [Pseudomonas typographi]